MRYIAAIDTSCVNPDGSIPENAELILDAIPESLLRNFSAQGLGEDDELSFFLVKVFSGSSNIRSLIEAGNYLLISVTNSSKLGDDWLRAEALSWGRETNDQLELFVRFDEAIPDDELLNSFHKIAKFSNKPDMKDSTPFELYNQPTALAVYDVGQASFSAIVDEYEHPKYFFDFGWPANFNKGSIPDTHNDFDPISCDRSDISENAPVVLSHLDWDHWGFAYESGTPKWDVTLGVWKTEAVYKEKALSRPWLMRRPNLKRHKLGPSHIHFVYALSRTKLTSTSNALNFWPERVSLLNIGGGIIFKCYPKKHVLKKPAFLRNNEGLGMLINGYGAKVLMAGDADYPSVPAYAKRNLTGIVAAHHGGKVTEGSIPNALGHGRMIFSVYPGCYSNVPDENVRNEAREKGWQIAQTSDRINCFRSSIKRIQCGNRLIRLSTTPLCICKAVPNHCICITKL